MTKKITVHLAAFFAAIAVMWGLLVLTSIIPNEKIYEGLMESADYYGNTEAFSFENSGRLCNVADNYADAILLNILWNIDSSHPVYSSLDTKYYSGEELGVNYGLYAALNGVAPDTDYSRYWHGSVIFIRPLMAFMSARGVKAVGLAAVIILAAVCCGILVKKRQCFAAAALAVSLCCVHVWNVGMSLEYIPMFIVTMAMCILYVLLEKKGDIYVTVLSVIGGAAAAFFDFLTAETLSILLPLLLVVIIRYSDDRLEENGLPLVIKSGCCWGAAYLMTFIVKWAAASAVTGENKFVSAIHSAEVRIDGETDMSLPMQIISAPLANLSTLFGGDVRVDGGRIALGLILTVLISGSICLLLGSKKPPKADITIAVLGLVPYLRYIVLSNHSYLHEYFTYRAQAATVMALCALVWLCIRDNKPTKKVRQKVKR